MPDDKIKISALPSALSLNNTDEMPVVQDNGGTKTTKRSTVQALGSHIAETMNFSSELETTANSLVGAINEAASDKNLADQYSNLLTYEVGDFVIYKTVLYKCITAVTVPEDFDPTKWTVAKVSDLVGADMSNYYTKSETDGKIQGLIDDAQTLNNKVWSSKKTFDEIVNILPTGNASGSFANFNTSLALPLVSAIFDAAATKVYHTSKYGEQFRGLVIGNFAFIELSQLTWTYVSANQAFITTDLGSVIKKPANTSIMPYFISSKYDVVKRNDVVFGTSDKVITEQVTGSVIVSDLSYTDAETLTNSLEGEYLIYELDTATTPTLTDAQFETLINAFEMSGSVESLPLAEMPITYIGENDIFADSGDCLVTFKKSIDDAIAELQALILNA